MTLSLTNISGGYGDTLIHRDLSLTLNPAQVLAIVGRNGTGKTTLARLITGELPLTAGQITLNGQDIGTSPAWHRARSGIVSMPQTGMVFDSLSVGDTLALTGASASDIAAICRHFPRLGERLTQIAGSMSGGERKILGFARAMLFPGSVIVLDEPSEGVQPENIARMQALIADQSGAGKSVLLLEQNVTMVEALAQRVVALDSHGISFTLEQAQISRSAILKALKV